MDRRGNPGPHFLRRPEVRLRAENWGGFALHRAAGDRLELDREAFAVLAALDSPRNLRSLREDLARRGHSTRLPELAQFVATLERSGFVTQVPPDAPPLCRDPSSAPPGPPSDADLRAPLVVHWAITYHCNLRCRFCYEQGNRRREEAGQGRRMRIVERLSQWTALEVALGGGEPFLVPELPELLAAIRSAGMVPNVTTNGTVLREDVIDALAQHAGIVHLSADRPELLDAARGCGVFAHVAGAARALGQSGVRLGANLLLVPENTRDIRRSLDALVQLGVREITFLCPKGGWAQERWPGFPGRVVLEILARELRSWLQRRPPVRLYVDTALRGPWAELGLLDDPEPEVLGCGGGQRHAAVTPKGDVYPCSHARRREFRMGNLLTDSLDSLWLRENGQAARRRFREACAGRGCPCCRSPGGSWASWERTRAADFPGSGMAERKAAD